MHVAADGEPCGPPMPGGVDDSDLCVDMISAGAQDGDLTGLTRDHRDSYQRPDKKLACAAEELFGGGVGEEHRSVVSDNDYPVGILLDQEVHLRLIDAGSSLDFRRAHRVTSAREGAASSPPIFDIAAGEHIGRLLERRT